MSTIWILTALIVAALAVVLFCTRSYDPEAVKELKTFYLALVRRCMDTIILLAAFVLFVYLGRMLEHLIRHGNWFT